MIDIAIPGAKHLKLQHLALDYNGTLAFDGVLIDGVRERLNTLARSLDVHVLTADTFGGVQAEMEGVACTVHILPREHQDEGKLTYVQRLGADACIGIGNGRNDWLMLKAAALGIVVMQGEGVAVETLLAADVIAPDILAALDLLTNPLRLIATLRT